MSIATNCDQQDGLLVSIRGKTGAINPSEASAKIAFTSKSELMQARIFELEKAVLGVQKDLATLTSEVKEFSRLIVDFRDEMKVVILAILSEKK